MYLLRYERKRPTSSSLSGFPYKRYREKGLSAHCLPFPSPFFYSGISPWSVSTIFPCNFFFVVVGSKSCVRKWFSFGIVIICLYSWDHLKKGNELVRFRCSPESELGFPAFSGPCGTGPASSMAYLKSGPYAVNGIGLMSGMDSLHSSMGYPPGKRNRKRNFIFRF